MNNGDLSENLSAIHREALAARDRLDWLIKETSRLEGATNKDLPARTEASIEREDLIVRSLYLSNKANHLSSITNSLSKTIIVFLDDVPGCRERIIQQENARFFGSIRRFIYSIFRFLWASRKAFIP